MSTALTNRGSRPMRWLLRPFEALQHEFDDLFSRLSPDWDNKQWSAGEWEAACDLSETADAFQIRMDMPGMKPDDITIEVTGDVVRISGERKQEKKEEKGTTYHRMERHCGCFSQSVMLPGGVNDERVEAEFHDGVLTVKLPKTQASKTRTVKVRANGSK